MTRSYSNPAVKKKNSKITPILAGTGAVVVAAASYWALSGCITNLLSGNKASLRTTWLNFCIPEYIRSEEEDNDSYLNANRISTNVEYRGALEKKSPKADEDWYSFTLSKGGSLGYKVNTAKQKDNEKYWNVSFCFGEYAENCWIENDINGKTTEFESGKFYFPAGEYYFRIKSSDKHSADPYRFELMFDEKLVEYTGNYVAGQGITGLNLIIRESSSSDIYDVWFNFFPHSSNPSVPTGRIKMEGRVIEDLGDDVVKIQFTGKEWLDRPDDYSFIDFEAILDRNAGTLICEDYQMSLIREDLVSAICNYNEEDVIEWNGHRYCYFAQPLSWGNAENTCQSLGGHLVSINSPEEQELVQRIGDEAGALNMWIGAFCLRDEWKWTDGSEFEYTSWDEGKPDNYGGRESFAKFPCNDFDYEGWAAHRGKWDDAASTADGIEGSEPLSTFGFICEWDS